MAVGIVLVIAVVSLSTTLALSSQQTTSDTLQTFPVGSYPYGITVDTAGNIWVVNRDHGSGGSVSVLRVSDGFHIMTPTVGSYPFYIAFDGVNMWVTNNADNTVSVLRASDGFPITTICAFRRKRSVIPADGDRPFRSMAITESGARRSRGLTAS